MSKQCDGCDRQIDNKHQKLTIGFCGHLLCPFCLNQNDECLTCQRLLLNKFEQAKVSKSSSSSRSTPVNSQSPAISPLNNGLGSPSPIKPALSPLLTPNVPLSPRTPERKNVFNASDNKANIAYIGNLPYDIDELTLQSLFSLCGQIEKTTVHHIIDSNNVRRSYGFVRFKEAESVSKAKKFHQKVYQSMVIHVVDALSADYSLSIKNLPVNLKSYQLMSLFNKHGNIRTATCNGGYGKITFLDDEDRRKVQQTHLTIQGYVLRMSFHEPPAMIRNDIESQNSFAMYIGNIPLGSTREQLNNMFMLCGKINEGSTAIKNRGPTFAYGFVHFSSLAAMNFALTFDKCSVNNWDMPIILRNRINHTNQNQIQLQVPEINKAQSMACIPQAVSPRPAMQKGGLSMSMNSLEDNFSIESVRNSGVILYTERDFCKRGEIGVGSFGIVFKAETPRHGLVAVKCFYRHQKKDEEREIAQMITNSNHPNIVTFYGVLVSTDQTSINGYIMEYMCNNSVNDAIYERSLHIELSRKYSWISQAASALAYLHARNVIHRDVKPRNMLLKNNYEKLCICDMGTTRQCEFNKTMTLSVGTVHYLAPEMMFSATKIRYDQSADVYSLAISIWEIITQLIPFDGLSVDCLVHGNERPNLSEISDSQVRNFIASCWGAVPARRPTMNDVFRFFRNRQ